MNAIDIPMLTDPEKLDLEDRLHETVLAFKAMRASSFWGMESFRVSDVVSVLTTRQARWLLPYIGLTLRTKNETDVLRLPIDLPDDLKAGDGEFYTMVAGFEAVQMDKGDAPVARPSMASLHVMRLSFSTAERSDRKAA